MIDFICSYCNKEYHNQSNLRRHHQSCRIKNKQDNDVLIQKFNETIREKELLIYGLKNEINQIKEKNENEIGLLKEEIDTLKTENIILKQTVQDRQNNYDKLLDKFDRPNNNTVTINKTTVKQIVSKLEPICFNKIKESMPLFTNEYIDEGIKGFAQFLCDHSLNNKFITTDHSRNIIAYRTDFYDFIRDPECLTLINKTLKENHEEVIRKSLERMEHYREMMDSDDEEYAYCSEAAMRVYELKKFAEASVNQKPDENIKAIANIFCKHGLNTYQSSIN
jgi:hypothetical protein